MVREAVKKDLEGLLGLYTQLHDNPMPEQTAALSALWETILADPTQHIIVAEVDGRLVSSCVLVLVPNLTHGQRPYGLIENVITDAAYRKRGYASACLGYAKALSLQHACYKLMLMTGSKAESTLAFYRQAGYHDGEKTAFVQWL